MTDFATRITDSIGAFQDTMELLQEDIDNQSMMIEDLEDENKRLRNRPSGILNMFLICLLCYIYGAFFGMYMCPK